ncbi:hypothetical protein AKJ51_01205 [candidate division MSBL1 archaeon SCGC-AAA382A20]|uniref:Putative 3-methyladenine DNA glycosylase n=1 Tax=candidate division MSBL1 archaeon SCGC-AAA382A20 TaxID=1698280 RepID=A0A133VM39_9EURY|nr:hypothetical protein AKJ51_01205 [candidate division MSBL1 archaeon SCGC-AAA382A20]
MRLSRKFYERDTPKVARELLGKIFTCTVKSGTLKGKIVETEAYFGVDDPASRASEKKTKINNLMWEKGGLTLIYMVHGNWLFNVTTEKKGVPGAVLIRAVEPISGLKTMKKLRGKEKLKELTSGPGKMTQAFGISKEHHEVDLTSSDKIFISDPEEHTENKNIRTSHRIGVREDLDQELRFYIADSEFVS